MISFKLNFSCVALNSFLLLSSLKVNHCPTVQLLYHAAFIFLPSSLTLSSFYLFIEDKHLHSMIVPPQYSTMTIICSGSYSVFNLFSYLAPYITCGKLKKALFRGVLSADSSTLAVSSVIFVLHDAFCLLYLFKKHIRHLQVSFTYKLHFFPLIR